MHLLAWFMILNESRLLSQFFAVAVRLGGSSWRQLSPHVGTSQNRTESVLWRGAYSEPWAALNAQHEHMSPIAWLIEQSQFALVSVRSWCCYQACWALAMTCHAYVRTMRAVNSHWYRGRTYLSLTGVCDWPDRGVGSAARLSPSLCGVVRHWGLLGW